MRLRRAVPAGILDAGMASLATFLIGLQAARSLPAAELGAYALFFSTFLLAAVIPTQLVLLPAEVGLLGEERSRRVAHLRRSWRGGAAVAVLAAIGATLLAWVGADAPVEVLVPLAVTATACGILSPLQDHARRMFHLAAASWRAVGVSAVQLVTVVAALALFALAGTEQLWRPFGALTLANAASLGVVALLVRHSPPLPRAPAAAPAGLLRWGGWLLVSELAPAGAASLASVVITQLAGPSALGHAEAARVVVHPLFVLTMGLSAVMGPRSMEAAKAGDRRAADRLLRPFVGLLVASTLVYGALVSTTGWGNPLPALVPQAYEVPGLVAWWLVGYLMVSLSVPLRMELTGGRLEAPMARVALVAGVVAVLTSLAAVGIDAFARPASHAAHGLVLLVGYVAVRRRLYAADPAPAPHAR